MLNARVDGVDVPEAGDTGEDVDLGVTEALMPTCTDSAWRDDEVWALAPAPLPTDVSSMAMASCRRVRFLPDRGCTCGPPDMLGVLLARASPGIEWLNAGFKP